MLDEVGPTGKVYAIEPDTHNIGLLLQNVQIMDSCRDVKFENVQYPIQMVR